MKNSPSKPVAKDLPIELLMEPLHAARETFDEVKLAELVESIKALGVLEPILVEDEGGKYRIHAGHRRYIAALAAGLAVVPCRVYANGGVPGEAVKEAENAFREDLNPCEQAAHFLRLLERECDGDTDRLARAVGRTREFVEKRLQLLRGDELVFEALRQGQIVLTVAEELNKFKDEKFRIVYLDAAIRGGATARTVRQWRAEHENLAAVTNIEALPMGAVPPSNPADIDSGKLCCWFCKSTDHPYMMQFFYLHSFCRDALERMFPATELPKGGQ